jgi:hypothetical protein
VSCRAAALLRGSILAKLGRWSLGQPGPDLSGSCIAQKRTESIRAHIARDDQEIARRDLRQVSALFAEGDDPYPAIQATRARRDLRQVSALFAEGDDPYPAIQATRARQG